MASDQSDSEPRRSYAPTLGAAPMTKSTTVVVESVLRARQRSHKRSVGVHLVDQYVGKRLRLVNQIFTILPQEPPGSSPQLTNPEVACQPGRSVVAKRRDSQLAYSHRHWPRTNVKATSRPDPCISTGPRIHLARTARLRF
jgi:hypothetical protein